MIFQHLSLRDFTDQLSSGAPVPGGGGASALAGALGVALGSMVASLTLGKEKYRDVEPELRVLAERAEALRRRLLDCIDADAEAFEALWRAYALPKDDPRQRDTMERCLRDAAAVPLDILELCGKATELLAEFAEKGSVTVLSDAATGAALCRGAAEGAAMNVRVNTRFMTDRPYAEEVNARVERQLSACRTLADRVYNQVYRHYK